MSSVNQEDGDLINTMVEVGFLQARVDDGKKVNIFLVSGVKLQAAILSYDDVTIETTAKDFPSKKQLIYKAAIASISEEK